MTDRQFSEEEIEKYLKVFEENVLPFKEIEGHCFVCGNLLSDIELPTGPERLIVCMKDRQYFVDEYDEFVDMEW